MILVGVREEDAMARRGKVQRRGEEVCRIARGIQRPPDVEDDAGVPRGDLDAIAADFLGGPVDGDADGVQTVGTPEG